MRKLSVALALALVLCLPAFALAAPAAIVLDGKESGQASIETVNGTPMVPLALLDDVARYAGGEAKLVSLPDGAQKLEITTLDSDAEVLAALREVRAQTTELLKTSLPSSGLEGTVAFANEAVSKVSTNIWRLAQLSPATSAGTLAVSAELGKQYLLAMYFGIAADLPAHPGPKGLPALKSARQQLQEFKQHTEWITRCTDAAFVMLEKEVTGGKEVPGSQAAGS